MASSNKSIWLVVVLGAAAGLGFAVYYLTVLGPANERREMTQQIEDWANKKWYPTRACLVGAEPKAAAGYDAIVLRSAIPGDSTPIPGECRAFFTDLRRPGEVSSGDPKVEADWKDVEEAVGMLANAYAVYEPSQPDSREALGTALDRVDAAYARLREDAKLRRSSAHTSQLQPIAEPRVTALALQGQPVEAHGIDVFGHALAVHGAVGDAEFIALVRDLGDVRAHYLSPEAKPAAAVARWGVWSATPMSGSAELRAGELTEEGAPAADGVLVTRAPTDAHLPTPVFALGEEVDRLILFELLDDRLGTGAAAVEEPTRAFWVTRSHDRGATWTEQIQLEIPAAPAVDPNWVDRRVDLTWTAADGSVKWIGVDAAALREPLPARTLLGADPGGDAGLGAGQPDYFELRQCVSQSTSWWLALGASGKARLVRAALAGTASAESVAADLDLTTILACDDTRLLGSAHRGEHVELFLCEAAGCSPAFRVPLAGAAQFAATLAPDSGPVAATLTNDLLVIWPSAAPGDQQRIFRTADVDTEAGDYLRALVVWDGVLNAIIAAGGQVRILALPSP